MQVFIAAVSLALIVSFLCSVFESVLLSINHAQVESLVQQGKRSGRLLKAFKQRIDMPIAAILITNTIAHTMGTAVAGATYEDVFSSETLWIFTIVFTTAILLLSEIIPKTLGITHAKRLAKPVAYGIHVLTIALYPLVLVSQRISRSLRAGRKEHRKRGRPPDRWHYCCGIRTVRIGRVGCNAAEETGCIPFGG